MWVSTQRATSAPASSAMALASPPKCTVERDTRGARSPTDCRTGATRPGARPASRLESSDRRCRTRSGCRSRGRGSPSVAIESRKQAASRPRPPLPRPGSGFRSREGRRDSVLGCERATSVPARGCERHQAVAEMRAHQKLCREVSDPLGGVGRLDIAWRCAIWAIRRSRTVSASAMYQSWRVASPGSVACE